MEGPVPSLGVQEGGRGGHRVGVADVLRVEELSLVGQDLRGLLTVEHGEVGGHVDEDASVRGQAAGSLRPHQGGSGGGADGPGSCSRGGGAGRGGRAGLARRRAPGGAGAGHHGDGLQETTAAGPASCPSP